MARGRRMKKSNTKRKIFAIAIYIILFASLIYSGIQIYKWKADSNNNNQIIEKVKEEVIVKTEDNTYKIDFGKLKEQNSDSVAWLKVPNTSIDFPVVKAQDNSYYLTRNFEKQQNAAGWAFADYRNKFDGSDKNIIIYGHNRRDGTMFGTLQNILKEDWYNNEENTKITLDTESGENTYQVFSIYKTEVEDYYIKTNFKDDAEYEEFINKLKSRSIKNFNVELTKDDQILTLSTCANNNKYRIVLHAKKN